MKKLHHYFNKPVVLIIYLVVIFILSVGVRLYRFNGPIADWMSWRQADTAAVTRNFVKEGFTPLYPKFDVLNSLNFPVVPNPNRYFFAEFPFYNILTYEAYIHIGHFNLVEWGRIVTIFFSALTPIALYFLVIEYSSKRIGVFASFIYAFLPYNIYYGRVILPDPMYILFSVLALLTTTLWCKYNKFWIAILAGICFSMAILLKPYALVLILPIAYLILWKWKHRLFVKPEFYLFLIISFVPYLLWQHHIDQHPEGQFATLWLFNQGNIRFTGAYFYWLIYDRMNRLIFATGGFALFWIGIVSGFTKKDGLFYYAWLVAIFGFFVIIARGNVTHDYYQMPLVPIGVIFIAKGIDFIISLKMNWFQRGINVIVAVSLVLMMFAFGWYEVRGYFDINNPAIVQAGQAADMLLPKNAIVITPYQNDSSFLYQTNRYGYTVGGGKIPQWIKQGAQYLVSVNYDSATHYWMDHCSIVTKNSQFIIVNLTQCKNVNDTYAATLSGV
jgi:4-amino-4-deoxy-L-arabinose transferase-like glycosyltransferase